ncbi:hypothetical protein BU16DRAFT_555356 [Lophium mytilinum]|uniref:Uncharacterized protein n=1 Tax=Lophium mytilinum TaxID=390894 RepID=A0A6A6RJ20_9PEZI|nr:hypothetical protein BU16DRAFT_555356 [Lophium mytilinum]
MHKRLIRADHLELSSKDQRQLRSRRRDLNIWIENAPTKLSKIRNLTDDLLSRFAGTCLVTLDSFYGAIIIMPTVKGADGPAGLALYFNIRACPLSSILFAIAQALGT